MKCIIIPAEMADALSGVKFMPVAKDEREGKIPVKLRELWGLYAVPLVGRLDRAIPADVLDHPAYSDAVAELGSYAVEDLVDVDFDIPKRIEKP